MSNTLTPSADENDPGEQPMHTDELVAPAEPDAVSVADAINKHAGLTIRVTSHNDHDINGISLDILSDLPIYSIALSIALPCSSSSISTSTEHTCCASSSRP